MKLITLNIWGGKLFDPLKNFVTKQACEVDIFCFQEIYKSPKNQMIAREMYSNIYGKLAELLPEHKGYFAPHLKGYDIDGKVDFELETGLAIFIKKSLDLSEQGDIFVYREGLDSLHDNSATIPRNVQYVSFTYEGRPYFIGNFHGIWYPKTKLDTPDRGEQSRKIKSFLNKQKGKKIVCGDFNLMPDTESLRMLEQGMKNLIKEYNIPTTRNDFYKGSEKFADYILISPDVVVKNFKVIEEKVSDHLPLYLEFE